MISIICVFNNQESLEEQLKKSLALQNCEYELIAVNNSQGTFKSAADALNHGAAQAAGDVFVFSHQDIFLKDENQLNNFYEAVKKYPIGYIFGIAGAKEKEKNNLGLYTSGASLNLEKKYSVTNDLQVSCVDECFFGMRKETYLKHPFDSILCDNWHLYAVEMCLYWRKNNGAVYLIPTQVHHYSKGKINFAYMKGLVKLVKYYRNDFKYIWTTCYKVSTHPIYINVLVFLWMISRLVRGKLK